MRYLIDTNWIIDNLTRNQADYDDIPGLTLFQE